MTTRRAIVLALTTVCLVGFAVAQESDPPFANWVAPPYWTPGAQPRPDEDPGAGMVARVDGMQAQAEALPTSPLPFVAIAPCRIVDTRQPISDGFHQPNFANDESRPFPFPTSPDCPGLPATAGAWSLNIQFRPMTQLSFLTAYPTGTTMPGVSTMTASPAAWVQNAAIVPAGTGGAIDIYCQYAGRVVVDINGYYGPQSVVTSLTGGGSTLAGGVTLAQGSNVTITPSGQTLTIAATAPTGPTGAVGATGPAGPSGPAGPTGAQGPPGVPPAGSSGQTLRHNGAGWVASSALTNDGTNVGIAGNINLPVTTATSGQIFVGANRFLHSYGAYNTFLGAPSGNFTLTGAKNTGIGVGALASDTSGEDDTAVGTHALLGTTSGSGNTGLGSRALEMNTTGTFNTAVGYAGMYWNSTSGRNTAVGVGALFSQAYDNGGIPWDADNTAIGYETLSKNVPSSTGNGIQNTGLGSWAMRENTTGSYNVALGYYALKDNTTGSGNVAIGHSAGTGYNGDNQLFIGNGLGTLIWGDFNSKRVGINTLAGQTLSVGGTLGIKGGAGFTVLQGSGAQAGDVTYTLPASSTNGVLRNSSGMLTWDASTSPGGSGTAGRLAYWTAPSTLASAAGLAWDAGNGRLGIGTPTPGQQLELTGNLALPTTTATTGQIQLGGTAFVHNFANPGSNGGNTFVGQHAGNFTMGGLSNSEGSYNTAVGFYSLATNSSGLANSAFGFSSLTGNTTGSYNTAVGTESLRDNTSGSANTAVGQASLIWNTIGNYNTALGGGALHLNTTASRNTAVGYLALDQQTYRNGDVVWYSDNTAVGWEALNKNNPTSIWNGVQNTALGSAALRENTTGASNVAVGFGTLSANISGSDNTATGSGCLATNTTGYENTASGTLSLNNSTTGYRNTASGYSSMRWNTNGYRNTALGAEASTLNTTGSENTAVGELSLANNQNGFQNTAVGASSLLLTTGNYNVAVGGYALKDNTSGGGNVAIGHNSALGYNGDNQLFIGNGLGTLIWGDFNTKRVAIGMTAGVYQLQLNVDSAGKPGGGSWANSSDARLKRDVRPIEGALERLLALRGVSFAWIHPEEHGGVPVEQGFIAQDVERVFPEWVRMIEPTGADRELVGAGEQVRALSLPFAFDATLVEALREQQTRLERQQARIAELDEVVRAQQDEIEALKGMLSARNRDLERRLAALEVGLRAAAESRSH